MDNAKGSKMSKATKLAHFDKIEAMLPRSLFVGSKDWTVGDTVSRVEWLLLTIDTLKQQIEYLEVDVKNADQGA
jgi:hypothetical protein